MSLPPLWRIEIDGRPAEAEDLAHTALVNHGHFTSMQVRGGSVRGLALHLERLDTANRELFGVPVDRDRVRAHLRHALDGIPDATVRAQVFMAGDRPRILVAVRPPQPAPEAPQRLRSVTYGRPFAHIKHTGTFAQLHHKAEAERAGFDDALFVDSAGMVSETTIANIALHVGDTVVWPDAPVLEGITMQLLNRALAANGTPAERRRIHLTDLASGDTVFLTNSTGITPVARVNGTPIPARPDILKEMRTLYESTPWDPI
ncbi:aminotransferase class IV [Thermomonospora cellulosilytica]|uniref:Branched-subunit amino acid aminotransferase/4-amino-4-deoxychorismate lyase n=1 Tax=Thermomonospora cellulosilytica TaxID=1411118 RepID=A0A7W3MVH6_9ACTN|nr:aminotransferase class IV [Thermomonospora cellulosilytica]MBA9002614.1 branched-subunit amino acid aminotransferase/4-amino-4-deoxychorismate lyase [Thermomonospora cellulosilytica]